MGEIQTDAPLSEGPDPVRLYFKQARLPGGLSCGTENISWVTLGRRIILNT